MCAVCEANQRKEQDRLEGVTLELASALGVLWRHGNPEARTWVFLNFPGWARTAAITGEFADDPYVKFQRSAEPSA